MARGRRRAAGAAAPEPDHLGFAVRFGLLYGVDHDRVEPEDIGDLEPDERLDLELDSESYCELIREAARMLPGSPPLEILENAAAIRVRLGDGAGAQEVRMPLPPGRLREELITVAEIRQVLARHTDEILAVLRAARSVPAPGRPTSLGQALSGRPAGP